MLRKTWLVILVALTALGSLVPATAQATKMAGDNDHANLVNSIGMKLVLIPTGEFQMGSAHEEITVWKDWFKQFKEHSESFDVDNEGPQHRVRITRPFYLGAHHVTVGQFRKFVSDTRYKTDAEQDDKGGDGYDVASGKFAAGPQYSWRYPGFEQTEEHPVVNVSWNDATAFCGWLSRKEGTDYRLPTEAEWEYACRAGTTTRYWHGNDLEKLPETDNVADATFAAKFPIAQFPEWKTWIRGSDGYAFTAPVGSFRANPFGLYDLHGNGWQWCADRYGADYYSRSTFDDPPGPTSGDLHVLRGGCWRDEPWEARSAARHHRPPTARMICIGFRVARTSQ